MTAKLPDLALAAAASADAQSVISVGDASGSATHQAPASFPSDKEWVGLASEVVRPRVVHFCKKYCFDNRRQYRCTVDPSWSVAPRDSALCEWGNATYLWMLEELCSEKRLERVRTGAVSSVEGYWHTLVNSLPFWERFKDWRFQRRIRVPAYIKALDVDAHRIFWMLCDHDDVPNMAQRLGRNEQEVAQVARDIQRILHERGRTELLRRIEVISLTGLIDADGNETELPLPTTDVVPEDRELHAKVRAAYEKLTWQEQFIVDAMVTDGLSARAVLQALVDQNISLDGVTLPHMLNVQHVYYFLRKVLSKVAKLAALDPEEGL